MVKRLVEVAYPVHVLGVAIPTLDDFEIFNSKFKSSCKMSENVTV